MDEEEQEIPLTSRKTRVRARGFYGVYEQSENVKYWVPVAVDSSGRLIVVES